jgi:hypothetical protein
MLSTICEAAVVLDGTRARDTEEGSAEVQPQVGGVHMHAVGCRGWGCRGWEGGGGVL